MSTICTKCEAEFCGSEWGHTCKAENLAKVELLKRILDVTTPPERLVAYAMAYESLAKSKHGPNYVHPAPSPEIPLYNPKKRRFRGGSIGEGPQM